MHVNNDAPLQVTLLEALAKAWLVSETPNEIGNDVEKIHILKLVARSPNAPEHMSELLCQLYREVFLRDVAAVAATA